LHECGYDVNQALNGVSTDSGPSLREELVEIRVGNCGDTRSWSSQLAGNMWTQTEADTFKDAISKLGKNFFLIRKEFVSFGSFYQSQIYICQSIIFL